MAMSSRPKIIIDSREARSKVAKLLRDRADVLVDFMEFGDYLVHGKYLVERKTVLNFVGSIKTREIWEQLRGIASTDKTPLLLVEGSLATMEKFTYFSPTAVLGAISAIMFDWRIPVVFTPNAEWSARFLVTLGKRVIEEGKEKITPVDFKPRAETLQEKQRRVIEALPSVGPSRAIALLRKFGSVRNIINADVHELMTVEGVGEKTAREIHEVVTAFWSE